MVLDVQITAIVGILLSLYALYVEKKTERNSRYQAICDINDTMNCGKVLTSEYSRILGISNSVGGILFYIVVFILGFYNLELYGYSVLLVIAVLSLLGSLYLAYRQYFTLKDFCLVCSSIYIVNILILVFSYLRI